MSKPTYPEIAEVIKDNPVQVKDVFEDKFSGKILRLNRLCIYSPERNDVCGSWCTRFGGKIIPASGRIECWCHYHETPYLLCEIYPGGKDGH